FCNFQNRRSVAFQITELPDYTITKSDPASFLPAPDLKVEADHSVLVAQRHDRNIPRHVVFHLDDLLIGNRDVGAVGEGEVARHLLLDGDLRPSNHGSLTSQTLGIDLDPAGSEQALQAAVDGAVESLIDQQVGGLSAESKRSTRRRGRRLLVRAVERQ